MPKWVMVCAVVTVALLLAYASYALIISRTLVTACEFRR